MCFEHNPQLLDIFLGEQCWEIKLFIFLTGKEFCNAVSRCEGTLTICITHYYKAYLGYILDISSQYKSVLFGLLE